MDIYVGNLSYEVTEEDLQSLFAAYGQVSSATIIKDKFTGQSRGFGFVAMPDGSEGITAMEALDGHELRGRTLKVSEARPRRPRRDRE